MGLGTLWSEAGQPRRTEVVPRVCRGCPGAEAPPGQLGAGFGGAERRAETGGKGSSPGAGETAECSLKPGARDSL